MKSLYIARHSIAQTTYEASSDYARRLTARGRDVVGCVAEWLMGQPDFRMPERIMTSSAPRALMTAEVFGDAFGLSGDRLSPLRELYSGDANTYLNILVRSLPDEVCCAMVVGHNPSVSELLAVMLGSGGYVMRKGDVAGIVFDIPNDCNWEEIYVPGRARLERYVIASHLSNKEQD